MRVLTAVELGMRRYSVVPVEQVRFFARTSLDEVRFRLDEIHRLELVVRETRNDEVGYYLNSVGYDVLAINALVEQGFVRQFGPLIGTGKEADVYEVLGTPTPSRDVDRDKATGQTEVAQTTPAGEEKGEPLVQLALKFHRLGRTSFRNVRKLRGYLGSRGHMSWLYASRLAAEREFEGLKRVEPLGVPIPRPVAQNRHAVLMTRVDGIEIRHFPEFPDPRRVYDKIVNLVGRFYKESGVVHGDLGEFNVLIDREGEPFVIDWPQWVPSDHPNAEELLLRDVTNVVNFFQKRYRAKFVDEDPKHITRLILSGELGGTETEKKG
ncbi:MAG: serine/threonine-protein kinase RIO2 [Promethearchaeota archaeon]